MLLADVDAFFLSVEQALRPGLRSVPCAVTGGGRGVILSASYSAREVGVRAGMPVGMALRACPRLQLVPARHEAYVGAGRALFSVLASAGGHVEQVSVDEAYWDVTELGPDAVGGQRPASQDEWASQVARWARTQARTRFGLPLSVGAGTSKVVAKIACDLAKPDGFAVVPAGAEQQFLSALPVEAIPGVGHVRLEKLHALGVTTVGDLARAPETMLTSALGQAAGHMLREAAHGRDTAPVRAADPVRSVGAERTFPSDLAGKELDAAFDRVLADALGRLTRKGVGASSVTVHHRTPAGQDRSRSRALGAVVDDVAVLAATARSLHAALEPARLRLAGVSFGGVRDDVQYVLPLDVPVPAITVTRPQLADVVFAGQTLQHRSLGAGTVVGLDGTNLAVRFSDRVRILDVTSPLLSVPGEPAAGH